MSSSFRTVLVLGGGNALGAYQAGVYQALHERDHAVDRIVGASAGAVNGALIAGNAPEDRLDRLAAFWRPGTALTDPAWWPAANETIRRTSAAMATLVAGRPGVFGAVGPLGSWWDPDAAAAAPGMFDLKPLAASLAELVDFERLNAGPPRYAATAVDLESGEDVVFDTGTLRIGADHIRASAALAPTFAPVAIGDRVYVDGGLSANLPLDPVLGEPAEMPTLCIAVDLLPLAASRPQTLGETMARAQDLIFAAQTRRTIARWRGAYAHDPRFGESAVTLAVLTYADQAAEVAGKAMDFSGPSVRHRWAAGHRDACALLDAIGSGRIAIGRPGLTVPAL